MTHIRTRFLLFSSLTLCLLGLSACEPEDGLPETLLIPTLELEPLEPTMHDLSARVIGAQAGVNLNSFTSTEAAAGFEVPADQHVLFRCPAGSSIDVNVAVGNPLLWNEVRYWGYEYSGGEEENRKAGKTGRALFDGRFWLSQGERTVSGSCYDSLHTKDADDSEMNLNGSSLYYMVISGDEDVNGNGVLDSSEDRNNNCQLDDGEDLNGNGRLDLGEDANGNGVVDINFPRGMRFMVSCVDADGDTLHTGYETTWGTDPSKDDTDGDGIGDSHEVLGDPPSNPLAPDIVSCGDGLIRGEETCDDGGTEGDDGCSAACTVEDLFVCTGEPSVCDLPLPILPGTGSAAM